MEKQDNKSRWNGTAVRMMPLFAAFAGWAATAAAENFTFNWSQAFPDNGDTITYRDSGGKKRLEISLFYTNVAVSASSPKNWCVDQIHAYPDEGGTITITGDPMTFILPKAQSNIYLHTNDCRLVFQNIVSNRTTYANYSGPVAAATINWYGGSTFLTTNWTCIAENANLANYEPIADAEQTATEGTPTDSTKWHNRNQAFKPENFVRTPDGATFQYVRRRTTLSQVVRIELKQNGNDIYARALYPAWAVWYDDTDVYLPGSDVDSVDIGGGQDDTAADNGCGAHKQTWGLFTNTDGKSGYGVNRIVLNTRALATVRYENQAYFWATATAMANARVEFAGDSEGNLSRYGTTGLTPYQPTAEIAFADVTSDWTVGNNALQRNGSYVFERTKAGESIFCLTGDTRNVMMSDGRFVVRGTEDGTGRMVLKMGHQNQMPSSNNIIRVEKGGELRLAYGGNIDKTAYRIIVCRGGILRHAGVAYALNTTTHGGAGHRVIADGGILEFGSDGGKKYIGHVTLKNGAEMRVGTASALIHAGGGSAKMLRVCGESPSTNTAPVELMGNANYGVTTNVFSVLKTGDGSFPADFVQDGKIADYNSSQYARGSFKKTGDGTMLLEGNFTSTNEAIIADGTLLLGGSGTWTNTSAKTAAPLVLSGGTLAVAEGKNMEMGRLSKLTADSGIVLGAGASVSFQGSSADSVGWASGAKLSITAPKGATVRFGLDKGGLTSSQVSAIRLNGRKAIITGNGTITLRGMAVSFR